MDSFPANIGHMFESFHQSPHGDFKPTFYNPFEIKHRRRTSRAQYKVLEKAFNENSKPSAQTRKEIAESLGMTPRGVQVWFQNRRAKSKSIKDRKSDDNKTSEGSSKKSTHPSVLSHVSNPMSSHEMDVRSDWSPVVDDFYLPDHIYDPGIPAFREIPVPPVFSPQLPFSCLQFNLLPSNSLPSRPPMSSNLHSRTRAQSLPNVSSTLSTTNNVSPAFVSQEVTGKKRLASPTKLAPQISTGKRPRAVSVPSLPWASLSSPSEDWNPLEESLNEAGEINQSHTFDKLPLTTTSLKSSEFKEESRSVRKNSGCSINFLNSFLNLGFVPPSGLSDAESPSSQDPYYAAIMKGGADMASFSELYSTGNFLLNNSLTEDRLATIDEERSNWGSPNSELTGMSDYLLQFPGIRLDEDFRFN